MDGADHQVWLRVLEMIRYAVIDNVVEATYLRNDAHARQAEFIRTVNETDDKGMS